MMLESAKAGADVSKWHMPGALSDLAARAWHIMHGSVLE